MYHQIQRKLDSVRVSREFELCEFEVGGVLLYNHDEHMRLVFLFLDFSKARVFVSIR